MPEQIIWGIHAGRTGDADSLFLKRNCIGLGWERIGDLAAIAPDREAFKASVIAAYPEKKPGAIPNNAGQLFRFVQEIQVGDLVAYPSKQDRQIHLGRITGGYRYDTSLEPGYPNLRGVQWVRAVPRTHFTQGALYEIGSAMSLFQIKNYADEFLAAFEGKGSQPAVEADETVAEVAEDIEETTRDFILKTLAQELKGHPFAQFVGHLLNTMGYRTRISPAGPDGGVDISGDALRLFINNDEASRLEMFLMSSFREIAGGVEERPLEEIAPLTRRPAEISLEAEYPGISARSFGRGTFHNPSLLGSDITWQKPYEVKARDILVSNIKTWEGAIAVVSPEDDGRFGSHRYLTFAPKDGVATPRYVCFYLLSPEGLHYVGEASPGSADRNRTTGSRAMQAIPVPVPSYDAQLWFDGLFEKANEVKQVIEQTRVERAALLPSILNEIFTGVGDG
ncbi:restriction endonuclease [Planctellipticum variicoloris]|uniref:restriction endonuclease n=1 Tax=Planctellipticum variicoloris TaxID=3064265 RepID=UPI0030136C9A|nr:restriction endonuclease [Planctomycetaceae bacterium SH412]